MFQILKINIKLIKMFQILKINIKLIKMIKRVNLVKMIKLEMKTERIFGVE